MMFRHTILTLTFLFTLTYAFNQPIIAEEPMAQKITSIEGITEYRLPNGAQVLLFPDASKSMVTVNMTVFVGSRHEGYGEAGMAHLLEHMLFKGTPSHPEIPKLMKNKGAEFNGTTWLDRTNYYESLPAASDTQAAENLEFAIRLEADRLVNSYVKGEDLVSEMTVVRNEFERGENNPRSVLMQRVQSTAFDWHNYGRSTIGNRSDIERVPIDRLQAFYRKFYRPDNIMLVIAGKFDPEQALALTEKYFGILESPSAPLDRTYTIEPPQDGERSVVLRRVGNTQYAMLSYHIPTGANREFAACEMLAYIFGTEPSGRLYRDLVLPEIASSTSTMSMALHDPGVAMFSAQIPMDKSLDVAKDALIKCVETVPESPITEEELKRAKTQFFKEREMRATDSRAIAIELSEWAAQGDWRLYFLFRDTVEEVTAEECTAAAAKFFVPNNRTLGLFIPTEKSVRVEMPAKPDLAKVFENYTGRGEIDQGELFDPDPMIIESRTTRGQLQCGVKTAFLPKKTRGNTVNIELNLRFGNEESLTPFVTAIEFLPDMLTRGTTDLSFEQLQDRLDELRCQLQASGTNGLVTLSIETQRKYLADVIPLVGKILREPRFDPNELDVLKRQAISATESRMTEPSVLAGLALRRALAPYESSNIRYVPTLEERIARYETVTVEQLKQLHSEQLASTNGEVAVVGDFDVAEVTAALETALGSWTSKVPFARVAQPAHTDIAGKVEQINTPDKANAVYYSGMQIAMTDHDPAYAPLLIGNYILGGGALSSRLGDRVRQQEGLSYSVGSSLNAHPIDQRAGFTLFAITNPENKDRVVAVIREEIDKLIQSGVTETELNAAIEGYLQSEQLGRTQDSELASILVSTLFVGRDMGYYARFESQVQELKKTEVDQALAKYLEPDRLIICTAGDFEKVTAEAK